MSGGMNRRGFLRALCATALLPVLPRPALAAAPVATAARATPYTYGLAVFHARTRGSVTAAELAARTGVSRARAVEMIARLLEERHIVRAAPGAYTAANPYHQNPAIRSMARKATAARRARAARDSGPVPRRRGATWPTPDLSRIVSFLRALQPGIAVSPA